MGIQHSTAADVALAARRTAYMTRHGLKDFKLSGRSLMRLVLSRCGDKAVVDRIRTQFTHHYGTDLRMESRTWDHLEMFGCKGALVALIAHPYSISDEGREDMALLHRAGLNVIEGGEDESWYGFSTGQIRVEHPCLAGRMLAPPKPSAKPVAHVPVRPAPTPADRFPADAETAYERRLRLAGPALLELARERAAELAQSLAMIPCVGPRSGAPCVACAMRADLIRINTVIAEIEDEDLGPAGIFKGVDFSE